MTQTEQGNFIEQLTGMPYVQVEWAKLIIPSGGLIELLQYVSHPDPDCHLSSLPMPANRLGCSHVALTVTNLDDIYNKMIDNGFTTKSPPLTSANGKVKILYAHDPDGAILELIQDL